MRRLAFAALLLLAPILTGCIVECQLRSDGSGRLRIQYHLDENATLGTVAQRLDGAAVSVRNARLDKDSIATVIDATHAALRRNYPDIERTEVAALLDLRNMRDALDAVMSASGLEVQDAAPGEAVAPSTGATRRCRIARSTIGRLRCRWARRLVAAAASTR